MSEIPYFFDTPVPRFFRENGLFTNCKNVAFVTWCFSRCACYEREIVHESSKITMMPYSFIFGRDMCSKDTGLSPMEIRTQTKKWEDMGLLFRTPNDKNNRFSLYRWSLDLFCKTRKETTSQISIEDASASRFSQSDNQPNIPNNQPNNQPNPQPNNQPNGQQKHTLQYHLDDEIEKQVPAKQPAKSTAKQPAKQPQSIIERRELEKESHHPLPSSKSESEKIPLTDDFSQKKDKKKTLTYIEVYPGVSMSQSDLDDCIRIKGSLDGVKCAIEYIMRHPGRKQSIYNWPETLSVWKIKPEFRPRVKENEEFAKRIEQEYGLRCGWRAYIHTDRKKDSRGILFENSVCTGNSEPIFIPFIDPDFREKSSKVIRDKRMQKSIICKS